MKGSAWIVLACCAAFGCAAPRPSSSTPDASPPPSASPAPDDWPQFRGVHAAGVVDGQNLPESWDGETGENVRWRTPIPGLAHSSPVIWGDRLFVTTAINTEGESDFKPGLYGDGDAAEDRTVHRFVVLALDKRSGEVIWERTAHEGVPIDKRHIKASYANATPVTDGRRVVAWFGSQGLFAFDRDGEPLWHVDLGRLDVGAYNAPDYEWGSASSPIIYGDLVIVQADHQGEDFIQAMRIESGEVVWRTPRNELPSWGTPTIWHDGERDVVVANGSNHIMGYDPRTGEELWRLGGSSQITAPTPVWDQGGSHLLVVASGRRPAKPIFAIRPGARGDITPAEGEGSSEFLAWYRLRRGPYMPTPLILDGLLYTLNNDGIFACYELATGQEVYRLRIEHGGSGFSASPVAADGKLYLPGEDGSIFVVRAGREYELLGVHGVPELVMATPAISGGALYVRGKDHLYAISRTP